MAEESFKIELNRAEIKDTIQQSVIKTIKERLEANAPSIERSIDIYFKESLFTNKQNQFDAALDYTIEAAFRDGLTKAMEELNFKEVIAQKARELLQSSDLIEKLAEEKVRASLGLPRISES